MFRLGRKRKTGTPDRDTTVVPVPMPPPTPSGWHPGMGVTEEQWDKMVAEEFPLDSCLPPEETSAITPSTVCDECEGRGHRPKRRGESCRSCNGTGLSNT